MPDTSHILTEIKNDPALTAWWPDSPHTRAIVGLVDAFQQILAEIDALGARIEALEKLAKKPK